MKPMKIRKQSPVRYVRTPEELSRQLGALELENAQLLNKIHMLERDVLPTIYKILSQRKKMAKKFTRKSK